MTDFRNALFHLMPEEIRKSFTSLDKEQTLVTDQQPNDIRVEPSRDQIDVQWSLSQWRDLRMPQFVVEEKDGADFDEADVPDEIREVQSVFPSFYASMNN